MAAFGRKRTLRGEVRGTSSEEALVTLVRIGYFDRVGGFVEGDRGGAEGARRRNGTTTGRDEQVELGA